MSYGGDEDRGPFLNIINGVFCAIALNVYIDFYLNGPCVLTGCRRGFSATILTPLVGEEQLGD
jgi:hypothetical protein